MFSTVIRKIIIVLPFAILLLPAAGLHGQSPAERFGITDWFMRPVAPGVEWRYYKFDSLFGSPQSISYIEADLDVSGVRVEFPYLNGRQRTSSMIPNQFPGAAAGVNGTFFSVDGHRTFLRIDGTNLLPSEPWVGKWGYNGGYVYNSQTKTHDIVRIPNDGSTGHPSTDWATLSSAWTDAMVNGPLIVRNGSITNWAMPGGSHCNRNPRTCVGVKPGNKIILMVADGRTEHAAGLTCVEMAEVMLALGCTDATSLDGGGSSVMYARGEPDRGVVSYPSDNGEYDHFGERSVSNAIAIIGNPRVPLPFDARLELVSYTAPISPGQVKYVTVRYRNIGSQTWTSDRVTLTTSRPFGKNSKFYHPSHWESPSIAWRLPSGVSIPPNNTYTFSFPITGPEDVPFARITETFQLTLDDVQRFGPADSALEISVVMNAAPGSFIVESRSGGQNYLWYSDSGFADTGTDCSVGGATDDIGMRYGSTYRSVAGAKSARWYPQFPARGFYRVFVAWGAASSRRSPITYHIHHMGGRTTVHLNQAATANEWIQLAAREFEFAAGMNNQGVEMTNENIDVSGSMYAGPVLFDYVGTTEVADWAIY